MMRPTIAMPRYGGTEPTHHGLGWKLYDWESGTLVGHNGGSVGHGAFLRLLPTQQTAVALVGNTVPATASVWARLSDWLWTQLGVSPPHSLVAAGPIPTEERARYTGIYEMRDVRFTIDEHEERLRLELAAFGSRPTLSWLSKVDDGRLLTSTGEVVVFESCGGKDLLHQGPYTARRWTS